MMRPIRSRAVWIALTPLVLCPVLPGISAGAARFRRGLGAPRSS